MFNTQRNTPDYTHKNIYPNISVMLRIMATIPVITSEFERSVIIL